MDWKTILIALAASAATGFLGAWLGAWLQIRHDRKERLRARRIDAADELAVALSDALLALSDAINLYELGKDEEAASLDIEGLISAAVTKSSRADLLFVSSSLTSTNSARIFRELRRSLHLAQQGNIQQARKLHGEASMTMAWLTYAASDAIRTTGTRRDRFRDLRKLEKQAPQVDPANRPE